MHATGKSGADVCLSPLFKWTSIVCGGFTRAKADAVLSSNGADMIAFATLFISNPDLPRRLKDNLPSQSADPAVFYAGEKEKGYTDFPPAP